MDGWMFGSSVGQTETGAQTSWKPAQHPRTFVIQFQENCSRKDKFTLEIQLAKVKSVRHNV